MSATRIDINHLHNKDKKLIWLFLIFNENYFHFILYKSLVDWKRMLIFVITNKTIELMSKPRFFQAVLKEVKGDILDHVYPHLKGENQFTLEERMGFNANCPDCDCNSWILLPKESVAVSEGGKPYCECMNCGLMTHL